GPKTSIICSPMTSLKTSIKTITYLSDIGCLEIQGASLASGNALFISELGPLPENVTWLSPEGEFQKWNGTAWVKDTEAEKLFRIREAEETKNNLMQVASEHIAPLQDAADLEIATEEEISLLEAWKKYRVLLNRVDTSTAQDIEWPALP
ncbi:tail fiber assembly protein, partial [Escherichia coli]|nr:tail fiber assembly protein [Escherichia coli]